MVGKFSKLPGFSYLCLTHIREEKERRTCLGRNAICQSSVVDNTKSKGVSDLEPILKQSASWGESSSVCPRLFCPTCSLQVNVAMCMPISPLSNRGFANQTHSSHALSLSSHMHTVSTIFHSSSDKGTSQLRKCWSGKIDPGLFHLQFMSSL